MSPAPEARLAEALETRRILVVGGSGGVGKTTTSAALALRAALLGRRVLVCTIDPSRRLATSLGLQQLSGRPRQLSLAKVAPQAPGQLWAMMLDVKRTFDALVERYARNEESRRRILDNTYYKHISAALAGSHEYMAMEKLLDLAADPRFDLVVLDTPPTRHALDFLEAPDRMVAFLDTSVLRHLLRPYFVAGRLTIKVATKTGALALELADKALGLQFLRDLSEFFLAFDGMYEGFKERAGRVFALLRDPGSGFVLVASPARQVLDEAGYFHRRLAEKGMPFVAFVVNRVHADPAPRVGSRQARGERAAVAPALAAKLVAIHRDQQALAGLERANIARLEVDTGQGAVLVPEHESDIHDMRGLLEVGMTLVPPAATASARRLSRR